MSRRDAFSLVELVVVVLILGILAAVAVPKLLNVSARATDNGLKQTLSGVRDAIDLYASENAGKLPPCTGNGADFRKALDPYVCCDFPVCPVGPARNNLVKPTTDAQIAGAGKPVAGWKFNVNDGKFICNYAGFTSCDPKLRYDQL